MAFTAMTIQAPTPAELYHPPGPDEPALISLERGRRRRISADLILRTLTGASALAIVGMLAALLIVLTIAAMPSIRAFGWKFLVSTDWRPNVIERPLRGPDGKLVRDADGEVLMETLHESFGALNVIYGTAVSSAIALVFAVPLSLGAALFLVRVASGKFVAPVSFLIEFLAAIPSIAYGIWGLFVLAPFLQQHVEPFLQDWLKDVPGLSWMFWDAAQVGGKTVYRLYPLAGRDMFSGGLILAIMIVPIITAISRDVLRAVPRAQVEGTTALGATWWQSSKEMLKFSRSGLFGAIMLGLARAAGETMAVAMVIGNNNQIEFSPFAPAQTMSSLLANEFAEANGELHPAALTEVALILLVMSLIFNVVARWLVVGKGARTAAAH
jgi:phosphate transport system permease protein